jgi:para-aminobenzoate synthetase/4-amino-4-deoxychorismate lyase
MRALDQCTALLFDGSPADATSRLCVGAQRAWAIQGDESDAVNLLHQTLSELDALARSGTHIVLSMSYEALAAFSVADGLHLPTKPNDTPWLQALAFHAPQKLNHAQALDWLAQRAQSTRTHLTPVIPKVSEAQFIEHIQAIRALIAAGDTYQVNYTFPMSGELLAHTSSDDDNDAALAAVYHQLVQHLKIPYGAFLTLPHNSLLSFSPELFVEVTPTALTCRPMKGTAAVADNDVENTRRAAVLAADPKNRAENLMIVDLMRNDLSRLSQVDKVTVPKLFEVKRYGTVLQMTSTVKAHLNTQPSLNELFNALFPCGSITGAPKRRTIEIIDVLEPYTRGAYCGTIGLIEPAGNQQINATFNVPIRTIQTTAKPTTDALGIQHWPLQLSVGAGITYDSDPIDEWQESLLKAKFLTQHTQPFELIETMRVESGEVALLDRHMTRLCKSAIAFGWSVPDLESVKKTIETAGNDFDATSETLRLRLALQADGQLSTQITILEAITEPVRFKIHASRMRSNNPFLQHKISARTLYNTALSEAKTAGLFDVIFLNEHEQITEGARSNIFILLNGKWYTPPLECGVLAGVQRSVLIEQLHAQTTILSVEDLHNAEHVILCNALYGALHATLME